MTDLICRVETASGTFEILRFRSYDIDLTLDIPADHFNIVFGDPASAHVGRFQPGDRLFVTKGGVELLSGIVDDVDCKDGEGVTIAVDGRDTSLLFLDNDAIPTTLYNISLDALARHFGEQYGGAFQYDIAPSRSVDKLVINSGESEWDVLDREARKQGMRVWVTTGDTVVIRPIDYEQSESYRFERFARSTDAIPVETAELRQSGANVKSEVWLRAYNGDSIVYKSNDEKLIGRGVVRRRIIEVQDEKGQAEAQKNADDVRQRSKVGSWEYVATINGKHTVQPGRTARVVDPTFAINEKLYIVGVTLKADSHSGTRTLVRMRRLGEAL